ncbi:MAG: methyltransferase [Pseudomonadota bacterium]
MSLDLPHALDAGPRPTSLKERWVAWRNGLLSSPKFQRFAARFPLTRPVASKRASELFDLVGGFVYSQILYASVETRLLSHLKSGASDLPDVIAATGLPRDGALRLLDGAISLRLVERVSDKRYALGDLGAALMANPGVLAMIRHHALLYSDLSDPIALLRSNEAPSRVGDFWAYARQDGSRDLSSDEVAEYSDLMAVSQQFIATEILDNYDVSKHKQLLDVGGGQGAFAIAAADRAPGLTVSVFDLPAVAARAAERFDGAGLGHRAIAHGGDLFADALPQGADLVTLVRVLYDHNDRSVEAILSAVYHALPSGGMLLVSEPMAETPGAEAMGAAYFGFYLLAMRSGASRSPKTLTEFLRNAGFQQVRLLRSKSPLLTRTLVCKK